MLKPGEKILVNYRRVFDSEPKWQFIGEVTESTEHVARAKGFDIEFALDIKSFRKRPEGLARLIPLTDALIQIVILPPEVSLESLDYQNPDLTRSVLTDGGDFKIDVNEPTLVYRKRSS